MSDLRSRVVDEIDRIDEISIGIPPPIFRALRAVMDRHDPQPIEHHPKPMYDTPYCKGCNGYWTDGVCNELRAIARELDVEEAKS